MDDHQYISGQLESLGELLKLDVPRGSRLNLLFLDAFNPGLDLIRYAHEKRGINVRYSALVHGGTYLSDDLYDFPWLSPYENSWFKTYDRLYVSSSYSKSKLSREFQDKAKIFPWGLDAFTAQPASKRDVDVIFPHRLDRDKGAHALAGLAESLPNKLFLVTVPSFQSLVGNPYYDQCRKIANIEYVVSEDDEGHAKTLGRAKVVFSNSKQELYGYSVMKAVLSGAVPVLPKDQCYPDFFPVEYMYDDLGAARNMIDKFTSNYQEDVADLKLEKVRENIRSHSFVQLVQNFLMP